MAMQAPLRWRARPGYAPGRAPRRWSEDVTRQVFVLRQFTEAVVDVGRVDVDRLAILLAGQTTGAEGDFLAQAFEQGVQAPGTDVLGLLVDLPGDLGKALDTVLGELDVQPLGLQQCAVLLGERGVRLAEDTLEILRAQGLELDADRQAPLQLGHQ